MNKDQIRFNFSLNRRILVISLIVGILLCGVKMAAYLLTKSNAIFTDALESVVNIVAGAIGLYSLIYSSKPKDEDHPYGHGKVEFLSAGIEGGMILVAGCGIIGKAAYHLVYPQIISKIDIGLYLTLIAGAANYILGWIMEAQGHKARSPILQGGGQHLKTDAYSSIGLVVGLGLVWWLGMNWIDNAIALLFGLFITYSGYKLVRSSISGIMDKSDTKIIKQLVAQLEQERKPDWIDIHNLRVIKYGSTLHIDSHMTLPWYYDIEKAHQIISEIDTMVNEYTQDSVEFFIHTDPCIPTSCPICALAECPVRQHPFVRHIIWNEENVQPN
ncbi:MAG: cation diffusion facilitator family transporter, partial [Saprospiraceae bacterium]